jgi:tetratricopeptide (TPR) repeat protein
MKSFPAHRVVAALVLIISTVQAARAADPATLRSLGRYSQSALAAARAHAKSSPQDAGAWTDLGKNLMRKYVDGNGGEPIYVEGIAALDKAIGLDASAVFALAYRGVLKAARAKDEDDKGLAKSGLADLDSALAKQPASTGLLYLNAAVSVEVPRRWGRSADSGDRLEKVTQSLTREPDKAVENDIHIGSAYMKLAKYYREEKQFDRAIEAWKKSIEFDPDSSEGREAAKLIEKYSGSKRGPTWAPPGAWSNR